MLDEEYDEYDDYPREQKSFGERAKTAVFGIVIAALVVAVGATFISRQFGSTDAYGRIVAAGELYDAPTYQEEFSPVSYEVIHPELATSAVEEVITEAPESPEQTAAEADEERNQKAMDSLLKIDRDYVQSLVEERKKYKTHQIVNVETPISTDPSIPINLAEGNVDYYAGTIAPAIFVNPAEVGAEYLGNWKITAYCACVICCEKSDGITASGAMVQANHTIAAPKEFKFGTKMIVGGQLYVVEDRGGGIHGNRIDIYFNSHQEANNFGVRYMDVYVIR